MAADFVDLNLLPRPTRVAIGGPAWRRRLLPGIGLLLAALLFLVAATAIKVRNDRLLAVQQAELALAQQGVSDLTTVLAEVQVAQEQVETLARQTEQLEADAEEVTRSNRAFSPLLRTITEALLPRMRLTGLVEEAPGRYRVQGEAGSSALVSQYVNVLRDRPGVGRVTPQSVEQVTAEGAARIVRWVLLVEP